MATHFDWKGFLSRTLPKGIVVTPTSEKRSRKIRLGRRGAVIAAGVLTFASAAGANVLVQNFMSAGFSAGAPPCLIKVAGEDVASFPDGFAFNTGGTGTVDGVALTEEFVTITGVTGDRVVADEVFVIENNCTVDLDVSIVNGAATGDWTQKHLEVWLGNATNAGAYPAVTPAAGSTQWDQAPVVFDPAGVTNATTSTITISAGDSVPVGMIVSTGQAATGTGSATWVVQAEAS